MADKLFYADMKNMEFIRKLPIPKDIKAMFPLSAEGMAVKAQRDTEIKDVFDGKSDRMLLIIGPCSADKRESVMEYLYLLRKVADETSDKLIIIPRLYTNKPRTSGFGYMGMLHQPDPNGKPDILNGMIAIRKLHLDAINKFGFSCADELLYTENYRYLSDLLSYTTVGARSVENQQHRLTASGLDIPVGMKNPLSGDLNAVVNAVKAAHYPHSFLYRGWEVMSKGNTYAHGILRGYVDCNNNNRQNYSYESISELYALMAENGIESPSIIIDTNHSNSGKQYEKQAEIALDIVNSKNKKTDVSKAIKGLMIESYLLDGSQEPDGHVYGLSITDPCLGWKKTEKLIYDIAERL